MVGAARCARKDVDAAGFTVVKASRSMKATADKHGGRYDGWEAKPRS